MSTSSSATENSPPTRKETKEVSASTTDAPTRDASTSVSTQTAPVSTLIEFPGAGRAARPQWRKDLSERVREIQQRRAREAALEAEHAARLQVEQPETANEPLAGLGLVPPPPDSPQPNPLVAAALRRIERARQPTMPTPRASAGRGGAAAAVARVAEESYQAALELPPELASKPTPRELAPPAADALRNESKPEKTIDAARPSGLIAVPTQTTAKAETSTPITTASAASVGAKLPATPPKIETGAGSAMTGATSTTDAVQTTARRVIPEVIDDAVLERLEAQSLMASAPFEEIYDDRAPRATRFIGGIVDLLVVAFFSSPFAATIELTSGNWADPRVSASLGGIILIVMFVYLTCSTALAGHTWGMSLFSLRVINAETAMAPSTGQCVRRAIFYMLSLALGALPILYAIFDAEGRAAHDHLSGTMVVRD